MKKLFLIAAATLGTVAASQAGVDIRFGIPFPFPSVVIGRPAPPVVYEPPVVYQPPVVVAPQACSPVVVAPPVVACPPAPIVVAPYPRRGVYYRGRAYYGHEWEHVHHHR